MYCRPNHRKRTEIDRDEPLYDRTAWPADLEDFATHAHWKCVANWKLRIKFKWFVICIHNKTHSPRPKKNLHFHFEIKFEQRISDLESTLARKHIHAVSSNDGWKIATSRRTIAVLFDLFPLMNVTLSMTAADCEFFYSSLLQSTYHQWNSPHIIESCISIVASIDPKFIICHEERPINL